jgi:hypothetical protein
VGAGSAGPGGNLQRIAGNAGAVAGSGAAGGSITDRAGDGTGIFDGGDWRADAGAAGGTGAKGRQKLGSVNLTETEHGAGSRFPQTTYAPPAGGTLALDETHDTVYVDATGGAVTIAPPDASTCPGRQYKVKHVAGINNVLITPVVGAIEGGPSYAITVLLAGAIIGNDGTDWWVLAKI